MLNCGVTSVYSIQRRPELIIKLDNTRWVNHNSLTWNMHQAHVWHRLQENIREIGRDSFQSSSPENVAQCQTPSWSASFFSSIEKFSNNFVCGCTFYSRIILLLVCPLRSNFIGQFTKCVKQSRTSTIWSSNKLLVCICCGCVCAGFFTSMLEKSVETAWKPTNSWKVGCLNEFNKNVNTGCAQSILLNMRTFALKCFKHAN